MRCHLSNPLISSTHKCLHKLTISILVSKVSHVAHNTVNSRRSDNTYSAIRDGLPDAKVHLFSVPFVKQENIHCPHLPDAICKRRGESQFSVRHSTPN